MRSIILTLVMGMAFAAIPPAAEAQYHGEICQGYTYHQGVGWRSGDRLFQRIASRVHVRRGCCTYWATQYTFVPVQEYQQQAVAPPYEGWRRDLLKIAESQAKWNYQMQSSQQEQKEFLEAVQALGIGGYTPVNTSYPSPLTGANPGIYGALTGSGSNPYALYAASQSHTAPYAQQGSTVFGYDSLASVYPDIDLKVLFNQANNLAENAQKLSGQATGDFSSLVSQADLHRTEVAKIIARGQAAAQVLDMLREEGQETTTSTQFLLKLQQDGTWKVEPRKDGDPQGQSPTDVLPTIPEAPKPAEFDTQKLMGLISTRCLSCHGAENPKGGLDMRSFLAFDIQKKQEIVKRLVTDDVDKMMPKDASGGPGERLPFVEVATFFRAAGLGALLDKKE